MTAQKLLNAGTSGTPLVLVHGVGDSLVSWSRVVAELEPNRPMLMYTLRGHETDAENPPPPYEMADFVADLVGLLDEHGFSRAILAGFSLGGLIVQATALAHPDRVAALIPVGAVAGRSDEERERVLQRYAEVAEHGPYEVAKISVDRWYTPEYLAEHPEAGARTLERMGALDPDCYAAAYRVLATSDFADELHRLEMPVLAIAGEGDVGSPPHMSERIAASVADGEVVVVPHVKHQLLQETPDTIAKEIDRFVRDKQV